MILSALGITAMLALTVILYRRSVEDRVIRWQLYQLRDELRSAAFEDRSLLQSQVFRTLDRKLTFHCAHLDQLSMWTILPVMAIPHAVRAKVEARQRDFDNKISQPQHVKLLPIYEQSMTLLAKHLALRHLFVTFLAAITVVGIVVCFSLGKWFSQRILSDAIQPLTERQLRPAA